MNRAGCDAVEEFTAVAAEDGCERRVNVLVVVRECQIVPMKPRAHDAGEAETLEVELSRVVDEIVHPAELLLLHAGVARINLSRLFLLLRMFQPQVGEELERI